MGILDQFLLTGRVAIVTGGAQGLGNAIAKSFAEVGATVVLADIEGKLAESSARDFKNQGLKALALRVDVTKADEVDAMVQKTVEQFGRVDVLVTSAGVVKDSPIINTTIEEWQWHLDVDLTGVFLCCKSAGREMVRQGKGSIINISSMSGIIQTNPQPHVAYAAAKGGVIMFTRSLGAEWAKTGVRVNCIAPGYMATRLVIPWMEKEDWGPVWLRQIPMGRLGQPEELSGAALLLASDASSYMTGQVLVIDGGYTIW